MTPEAWLWTGALSLVGFWLGWRMGVDKSCRVFAALLIQFGLWDAYRAASERHERGAGVSSAKVAYWRLMWVTAHDRIRLRDSRVFWLGGRA